MAQSSNESHQNPSKKELLNTLKHLAEELGKTPTIKEMEKHTQHTAHLYTKHFESWNNAVEKAGLETNEYAPSVPHKLAEQYKERNQYTID